MESSAAHPHSAISAGSPSVSKTIHQLKNVPLKCNSTQALKSSGQRAQSDLFKVASQVLNNPVALRRLSERVLEIMRLDLQQKRERGGKG